MKILALGDVTGDIGVSYLYENLRRFKRSEGIDLTIVNAENSASGNGLDKSSAEGLFSAGADILTSGNHVFRISAAHRFIDESPFILRPANYPDECPGRGYLIYDCGRERILVMNVLGTVYTESLACPFETVENILKREEGNYTLSFLDIHAEATSEKAAVARHFDGRITGVFGTHTHVQTADARILPRGTGFITDLGMCGPVNSILGVKCDRVIDKMRLHLPRKFEYADGEASATGAIFTVDGGRVSEVRGVKF